jgi:ribonuclease BN (tRNA processing enzyme)
LVVQGEESVVLVDCAGSPLLKLQLAGIEPTALDYVIFTHSHPDHMYGFPILALNLWLLGCRRPLQVLGEARGLYTAQELLRVFRAQDWPGFCPPHYREVPLLPESVVLDLPDLLVTACPTAHLVPSMALKFVDKATGQNVVYSSDTGPSEALVRFARGADVLIHEAAGPDNGHSSPAEAAQVAHRAGVHRLFLIHYPVLNTDLNALLAQARQEFAGPVELARDYGAIEF